MPIQQISHLCNNFGMFVLTSKSSDTEKKAITITLSASREDIANDSSKDSKLSPSQLFAFSSLVPANILSFNNFIAH